jgi:hypothetical protein
MNNTQTPRLAAWNKHRNSTKLYLSGIQKPASEKRPQPLPDTGKPAAVLISYWTPVLVELDGVLYSTMDKFSNSTAKMVYKAAKMFAPENFRRVSFWEFVSLLFKAGYLGGVKTARYGGYDLGWLNSADNGGMLPRELLARKRISKSQALRLLSEQLRIISSVEAGKRELLKHGASVPSTYIIPNHGPSAGDTRFSLYALERELMELVLVSQALEQIAEGSTLSSAHDSLRLLSALDSEVNF